MMMLGVRSLLPILIFLFLASIPVAAGEDATRDGSFEIGGDLGYMHLSPWGRGPTDAVHFGLRGGYFLTPRLEFEGQIIRAWGNRGHIHQELSAGLINVLIHFRQPGPPKGYFLVGAGIAEYSNDTSTALHLGLGRRFLVGRRGRLASRLEFTLLSETTHLERTNHLSFTYGLSWGNWPGRAQRAGDPEADAVGTKRGQSRWSVRFLAFWVHPTASYEFKLYREARRVFMPEDNPGIGLGTGYRFNRWISLDLDLLYSSLESDINIGVEGDVTRDTRVRFAPVILGPNVHPLHGERWDLFIGTFLHYTVVGPAKPLIGRLEDDHGMGATFGIEWTPRPGPWSLTASVRYFQASGGWGRDVDPYIFQLGAAYRF